MFWDGGFRFFAGSSGCSGGFYIEDIASHEFGHALGLGHSTSANATMYPSVASCNMGNRTLDADDIDAAREAAVQALRGLPGDEVLYRLRMRVEHHAGNPAGVAAAYDELIRYLDEFDAEPSPATLDLHRLLLGTARAGT